MDSAIIFFEEIMTLNGFIIILFLDVIIISLAVKTKIYSKIITIIIKTMPYIVMVFILFTPLVAFILFINICNAIYIGAPENYILQTANEKNILMDLKKFGVNCIAYSPIFFLVLCFLLQAMFYLKNEKNNGDNSKKMQIAFFRMKTSLLVNNVTIALCLVFIVINYSMNIINIIFVEYILNYSLYDINIYSEDTIRIILIILLGLSFYIGIYIISINYIDYAIIHNNKINKENHLKPWKYKLLNYIPFINIYLIYLIRKKINTVSRENYI